MVLTAMPAGTVHADDLHARPSLVSERATLVPGGVNWLGVALEIDEGWHTYWDGFNDTGEPLTAHFTLPTGFEAGELVWPAPARYSPGEGILDHVYEREVLLMVPVRVPASAAGSSVTISAELRWLVCSDVCIPEDAKVSLTLAVGKPGASADTSPHAGRFEHTRTLVPTPAERNPAVRVTATSDRGEIRVPGAVRLEFYPAKDCLPPANLIDDGAARGEALTVRLGEPYDDQKGKPRRFAGVLMVVTAEGARPAYYSIGVNVEP
jgi:thiol:disulfide interchange protein DsbD